MKKEKETKISPYTLLNRWLYDGSKTTQIPQELLDDKSIGQNYLLFFFQQSPYGLMISKLFNNYGVYQLERKEIFLFIKDIIIATGYQPKFFPRENNERGKLEKLLKFKYPYLKNYEIPTIIEYIDLSADKDQIYETFGIYSDSKKKKMTKADVKEFNEKVKNIAQKLSVEALLENYEH